MSFLSAIAPVVGGLLGAFGSKKSSGGTTSQSASNEPWAAAQPWIRDNIQIGQDLQKTYQQTPFNSQQIHSYNNLFGDLDQFRNVMAPGLFNFANNMMTSQYQRPTYARPGMVGYSQSNQRNALPGLNLASPVFSMPASAGNYGLLDVKQTTPQILPTTMTPGQTKDQVWEDILQKNWDSHLAQFGIDWNTSRTTDAERAGQLKRMQDAYKAQMGW